MSDGLDFDEAMIESLDRLYRLPSMERRRELVRDLLAAEPGDSVLSVGVGPGYEPKGLAGLVGETGRVLGVDDSSAMLAVSRERCGDLPQVAFEEGGATALPVEDGAFDGATVVQVYEYVEDVGAAAAELYRALKPGGRAVVVDSDWRTLTFAAADGARSQRVLEAYDAHCVHPRIARTLRPTLLDAGFSVVDEDPHTHFETTAGGIGSAIADLVGAFVGSRDAAGAAEVDPWLADLEERAARDEFFFSFTQYAFVAEKPRE